MTSRHFLVAALAATLLLSASSCGKDAATQIVLIVDTDLSIPAEADSIQLVATGPSGMREPPQARMLTGAAGELPLVLALSTTGSELEPVNLTIAATRAGSPVVTRQITTSFVKGQGKTLYVFLRRACGLRTCPSGQTCGNDGSCTSTEIDANTLPDFTGTPPTDFDAGTVACTPADPPTESCNGQDDDCNGAVDEGDLCTPMSGAPTMGASCMSGVCVNACGAGTGDCDGLYENGCETDTDNSAEHCGACGTACDSGACVAGACVGGGFQTSLGTMGSTETLAGMAIGPAGSLFVTGSFDEAVSFRGMSYTPLGRSVYLAKYSATGAFIDAKAFHSGTAADVDTAVDIGVDSSGNVTLLMTFTGRATIGSDTIDAGPAPSRNIALLRFDNSLTFLGSRAFGSTGRDDAFALDVMDDGRVTIAAFAAGALNFMGTGLVDGLFAARFRMNSMGGFDSLWAKGYGSTSGVGRGEHTISDVVTDAAGNAYFAGHHVSTLSLDGRMLMGDGSMVFRLESDNGGVGWFQDYVDMDGEVRQLAIDRGNLLVLGDFSGSFNLAGAAAGGSLTGSSTSRYGFIGKLEASLDPTTGQGAMMWQRSIASSRDISAIGIAREAPSRVVGVVGFEASAMILGKTAPGIGVGDALAFYVTENAAGTNLDSGALPGLRPVGSTGDELVKHMAHRGGRMCIGGLFNARAPIDLLAVPDGTPYVPLGDPSMIVSSSGFDIFLACFSTGAIPLGGI